MKIQLSNKPGMNETVMQIEHPQQQRKITMKKVMSTLMLSAAIATSGIALPTQAAVGDATILNKVKAVKVDTGAIKSTVSGIKTRVEEVSSSVNANVAESIDIRSLVEPLDLVHKMKAKFGGGGFDPAELLETLDMEELQRLLGEMRAKKQEAKDRLNDPNLETFRGEFLEALRGINEIVTDGSDIEVTPFQTMIEKAPLPIVALLKATTQKIFPKLSTTIVTAAEGMTYLRASGALDPEQNLEALAFTTSDQNSANYLSLNEYRDGRTQPAQFLLANTNTCTNELIKIRNISMGTMYAMDSLMGIMKIFSNQVDEEDGEMKVGIHGYFGINFRPNKKVKNFLEQVVLDLEFAKVQLTFAQDVNGLVMDTYCP
jgi:hypothetical protein